MSVKPEQVQSVVGSSEGPEASPAEASSEGAGAGSGSTGTMNAASRSSDTTTAHGGVASRTSGYPTVVTVVVCGLLAWTESARATAIESIEASALPLSALRIVSALEAG